MKKLHLEVKALVPDSKAGIWTPVVWVHDVSSSLYSAASLIKMKVVIISWVIQVQGRWLYFHLLSVFYLFYLSLLSDSF